MRRATLLNAGMGRVGPGATTEASIILPMVSVHLQPEQVSIANECSAQTLRSASEIWIDHTKWSEVSAVRGTYKALLVMMQA